MLLKNGSVASATEIEILARELADVEVHCKDGRVLLWYRPLLAACSPMLRLGHLQSRKEKIKSKTKLLEIFSPTVERPVLYLSQTSPKIK